MLSLASIRGAVLRARVPPAGAITVGGQAVVLPTRAERRANRRLSLAEILAVGDAEHHGGCHGPGCDGRCAEVTYARWSAAGWR